jgi:nitroreductase
MNTPLSLEETIRTRHAIRRFLPTPVPANTVRELLELAARAPSGSNVQPWRVYALAGAEKETLSRIVTESYLASGDDTEIAYYPEPCTEPWLSRRRKVGGDLYALLGIARDDKEKRLRQWLRNYNFFDAPVGLIFTLDRAFGERVLLDYGMFMENLMLAARTRGLDTCPQLAFACLEDTVRRSLALPENERVICGMALGYADPEARENQLCTERAPAEAFTDFRGFGEQ